MGIAEFHYVHMKRNAKEMQQFRCIWLLHYFWEVFHGIPWGQLPTVAFLSPKVRGVMLCPVWPKVDPWQLENPAVPSTDPTSTPRARLSYPTAHAFTGPPTVLWPQTKSGLQHDKAQPNICIVELLPTTTCIEGFRLVLNSSKQPPKIFRGLSRCSCISTVDTTVVASPVHLFQFLAPKAVRKFSVHSDFNFFSIPVNKQRRQLILINTLILILVVLFMMELGDEACI